jgi:hypothetical protein
VLRLIAAGTPKEADVVANLMPGLESLTLVTTVGATEPFRALTARLPHPLMRLKASV